MTLNRLQGHSQNPEISVVLVNACSGDGECWLMIDRLAKSTVLHAGSETLVPRDSGRGWCNVVRQHALEQWVYMQPEADWPTGWSASVVKPGIHTLHTTLVHGTRSRSTDQWENFYDFPRLTCLHCTSADDEWRHCRLITVIIIYSLIYSFYFTKPW